MTLNIVISDRYHSNSIKILSGHSNIKKPTGCTGYLCARGVLTQTLPISPSLSSVSKSHCLAAELFSSVDDLGSNFRTNHSVLPSVVSIRLAGNSHISHIIPNGHVSLLCCTSLFCFFHQFSFNHILSLSFILSVSVTLLPSLPLRLLFTGTGFCLQGLTKLRSGLDNSCGQQIRFTSSHSKPWEQCLTAAIYFDLFGM